MHKGAVILLAVVLAGCARKPDPQAARQAITAEGLLAHTRRLASDEFEGRAPGTKGEDLTVAYLEQEFRKLGLKPGNPDGTYVQQVPMAGIVSKASAVFAAGGRKIERAPLKDFVGVSRRFTDKVEVSNSDMIFVGYGVVAPEYGWDDYKGVDIKGKTIVMLINDPAVPDPADPARLDDKLFKGRAMTYYGRWSYKYEVATEKGAAAAVIIHETGPAGYPFEVVTGSWGRENLEIRRPDRNLGRVAVESWISLDTARDLLQACGRSFDDVKKAAAGRDFRPVPLKARASFRIENTIREVQSRNVLARLEGSDPKRKQEWVIYTSHWDHLGRDETRQGDQIFNGARDNATGVAGLLELAKAFSTLDPPPARSLLFLAVTGEEKGLLGARYYAQNPLYPLARTLANINMDSLNPWGRTSDFVVEGLGQSTLEDVLAQAAAGQNRTLSPDPEPEKGHYYRSDHFEFAKEGVPALYADSGSEYVGKPAGWGQQKRDDYVARDYHKVSDDVKADWDLAGAADDMRLLFGVGYRVAQGDSYPQWKPGSEFKAKRDAMLAGSR